MNKRNLLSILSGASLLALGSAANAAPAADAPGQKAEVAPEVEVVVVTARRREESIQDVPQVINAVTPETIAKLNLRDFTEVQSVVPGLNLTTNANGIGGNAQLRGINFDINASGNNPTVEFYQNDAPITAGAVLQQMYDIGQVEVLRGPQGTLRGRASPSGSITVTTKKPNLYTPGGYGNVTVTDTGTRNINGAVNIPVIEGIAAIRIAGLINGDKSNRVDSINPLDTRDSSGQAQSARVSALVTPFDSLRLEGSFQRLTTHSRFFDPVESFNQVNATAAASPVLIRAEDRRSIYETPRLNRQQFDIYNGRAEYQFLGQRLVYQYQHYTQALDSRTNQDNANARAGFDYYQFTSSRTSSTSNEIRLQNEERVFGFLDYVVGYFDNKNNTPTSLTLQTPVYLPAGLGGRLATIAVTPIKRTGQSHEKSAFGNLTAHIGEGTEISGGLRYIQYNSTGALSISGSNIPDAPLDQNKVIYSLSAKHSFSRDLMVYASTGTSFRPGIDAVGDFSVNQSALEKSFLHLPPESSKSYETGFKSTLLGGKARANVSVFHQTFENYPYRAGGNGVYYVNYNASVSGGVVTVTPQVSSFNFVAAVPVKVNGIEGEFGYNPTEHLKLNLLASYAVGKVKDGVVPCNDLNGDGKPDIVTSAPTVAQLQAATNGNNLSSCKVSQRATFQPPFSANLQAEYTVPLSEKFDGYVRGLAAYYGKSQGDPTNTFDDVGDYGLLNLFAGLREHDGAWEISLYGKNVFDTTKVLSRTAPLVSTFQVLQPPTFRTAASTSVTSTYTGISTTQPREFGLTLRVALGSR